MAYGEYDKDDERAQITVNGKGATWSLAICVAIVEALAMKVDK